MNQLIWQGEFTFSTRESREVPVPINAAALVIEVVSNATDGVSPVAYALQESEAVMGSVSMRLFDLIPGRSFLLLFPSSPSKLRVFPRWQSQILHLKLWETTAPMTGGEISGDVATAIQALIAGQAQLLEELQSIDVEIDPQIAANVQSLLMGQTQLLQALQSIKVEIDPQIASNISSIVNSQATQTSALQGLQTGQSQILNRLNQPIEAELDPAIVTNISSIMTSQTEQTTALQQLQAGQTQILQALTSPAPTEYSLISTPYTASQSSVYTSLSGTYANLNDNSSNTGAATNNGSVEWIKATFATAQTVRAVRVGGGNLPAWGAVAPYLNGRVLQYSTDDVNWLTLLTFQGVRDVDPNQFVLFELGQPITARFWRILSNSWLSTTEFRFFQ